MAFELSFQSTGRKNWWLNAILYFAIALLLTAVLCYLLFIFKISSQKKQLGVIEAGFTKTGTEEQKVQEKKVFETERKIADFAPLLDSHKIPTNLLAFFERVTLPDVWFSSLEADVGKGTLKVSGEAKDFQIISQQIAVFQSQEMVRDIKTFFSQSGKEGRFLFGTTIFLDTKIFIDN